MFSSYASNSTGIMDDNIAYADKGSWDNVKSPGITDNEIRSVDKINRDSYVGNIGKYFTENHGQVGSDEVKFYIQGQGVWFTNSGIIFVVKEPLATASHKFNKFESSINELNRGAIKTPTQKSATVRLDFLNCNDVVLKGQQELPHKSNFFYGNDSSKWCTSVPNYQKLIFPNIYDKIDLVYYFNEDDLKYDLNVHKGGNPGDIVFKITGAEKLSINSEGDIKITTEVNNIFDRDLFVYQEDHDKKVKVPAKFKMFDSDCYGFEISGVYDRDRSLIIDPLIYSTYIGGNEVEYAYDVELDNNNNLIIVGQTNSTDFPKENAFQSQFNGYYDTFVLKLNSDGTSLLFSSYIGGSENESIAACDLDSNGYIYVTGWTWSDDFPITPNAYNSTINIQDAFVCRLNPTGTELNYSTYVGGGILDWGSDIIVNDEGIAYVIGSTISPDFPTTPGSYDQEYNWTGDTFVFGLESDGSKLNCSTFIGGDSNAGYGDQGFGITLDNNNNVCITGITQSLDFPTTEDAFDRNYNSGQTTQSSAIFISKFNAGLTRLLHSTFFEGSGNDWVSNIFIDSENNTYITGQSTSDDFPVTADAFDSSLNGMNDGFITKFNWNLTDLLYSTFFGGNDYERVDGAAFDQNNNIIMVGWTTSIDFPVTEGAHDTTFNGISDLFITVMNLDSGSLLYSSYLGGSQVEYTYCTTFDRFGFVYMAGLTLGGFPTTPGCYKPNYIGGPYDAFALKYELNCTPAVMDFKISDSEVYRPNVIELYSNVSDYEDLERYLTPCFEYLGPNITDWSTNFLSPPVFINERWQTSFVINVDSPKGYYSFRVRFNDTVRLWSNWYYLNGSLRVLNNRPQIDYFNISKSEVEIGDKLFLYVNGSDLEDDNQSLDFEVLYKHTDDTFWWPLSFEQKTFLDFRWVYSISINQTYDYGYYSFRAMVYDSDYGFCLWRYLNKALNVIPCTPKIVEINNSKPVIFRTEMVEVTIDCFDADSEDDELSIELLYLQPNNTKWQSLPVDYFEDGWGSYNKSKESWELGFYSFKARVSDMENNTSPWLYLNDSLLVLNNVPRLRGIDNIPEKKDRKRSITIFINASDKENSENELKVEFEYKLPANQTWIVDYLSEPYYSVDSWRYDFTLPYDAPVGNYSFRARVNDLDGAWSTYLYLNDSLAVNNILPEIKSFWQEPADILRTESVIITANCVDLETNEADLECNIFYQEPESDTWLKMTAQYNNTANHWYAELISTKSFILGYYSFKIHFRDNDGALSKTLYANETVLVNNNLPVISPDLDNIGVGSSPYILKLTDYGYDVETPKKDLKWELDDTSIDTTLFHIEIENIDEQEIVIYPVQSKIDMNDIRLILTDADDGQVIRSDITIIIDSRVEGGGTPPPKDENPVAELVAGNYNVVILVIIIIIIVIMVLFFFYLQRRRKEKEQKKEAKGETEEEREDEPTAEVKQELPAAVDETIPALEGTAPEPVPAIEAPKEPVPVPMPDRSYRKPRSSSQKGRIKRWVKHK
jgi:hypothetical protein